MIFSQFGLVFHGSMSVLIGFQGFRLVFMGPGQFYGFSRVQVVFQGSRLVFHGSRWVFMVFEVLRRFLIVPRGFLWFFKVPICFFIVPGRFLVCFSWFQVGFHGFSRFQFFFVVSCQS